MNTFAGFLNNPGDFSLSHAVTRAVPSAPAGLTSVFGMGTGVTLPTKSPAENAPTEFLAVFLSSAPRTTLHTSREFADILMRS